MNTACVGIHVYPSVVDINRIGLSSKLGGPLTSDHLSTLEEIRVNKIGDEYSVIYTDDVFKQLDVSAFAENLIEIFNGNMPNDNINISVHYWLFETEKLFSHECGVVILHLSDYLDDYEAENIEYTTSRSVEVLYDAYDDELDKFEFDNEEEDLSCCDEAEPDEIDPEVLNALSHFIDFEGNKSPSRNHEDRSYGSSRILKGATKNPKKQFKRHGIIIAEDKLAIKKDEKIIKAFLKDFIPGNSKWIKEYRQEILERWMKMYAISKKSLKKLEKHHHKQTGKSSKNNKISKERAMNFTRNLFGNKDSWNDPNR